VIRIGARIDDGADRKRGDCLDRREHLVAHGRDIRIDDEERGWANLHGHIAAGPGEHVDAALHRENLYLARARVGDAMRSREILRGPALLGADASDGDDAEKGRNRTRVAGHFAPPVLIICFNFSAYSG
jgi:hypothetical protein